MDTLAHGLFGAAAAAPTRDERLMAVAGFVGMLPDTIVYGVYALQGYRIPNVPIQSLGLYHWTHSLLIPLVLLLILRKKWRVLALSYALHIVFDIFTHCGLFATVPFFPFSMWSMCGFNYADSMWAWEINYGVLVGIYFLIYRKFYRPFLKFK